MKTLSACAIAAVLVVSCNAAPPGGETVRNARRDTNAAPMLPTDIVKPGVTTSTACNDTASFIDQVDAYVTDINNRRFEMLRDSSDVWDESTEGGLLVSYSDSVSRKRIDVTLYGETGKTWMRFYERDGEVVAINCELLQYRRPFYHRTPGELSRAKQTLYFCDNTIVASRLVETGDTTAMWWRQHRKSGLDWVQQSKHYQRMADSIADLRKR